MEKIYYVFSHAGVRNYYKECKSNNAELELLESRGYLGCNNIYDVVLTQKEARDTVRELDKKHARRQLELDGTREDIIEEILECQFA